MIKNGLDKRREPPHNIRKFSKMLLPYRIRLLWTLLSKKESPSTLETDLKEAVIWVEANKATIPACVYSAVILLTSLRAELERTKARATRLLDLVRRELGVTPKSERGKPPPEPKPPKNDEDHLKSLKKRRKNLSKEIRSYEDRLGKGRKKKRQIIPQASAHTLGAFASGSCAVWRGSVYRRPS